MTSHFTEMRAQRGNPDFVQILTEVNVQDRGATHDLKTFEVLTVFIGRVLVLMYGTTSIKALCARNKGHLFLEMMSMSYFAYAKTILMDKSEVYEEQYKMIEDMSPEDEVLYKAYKRSKKNVSPEMAEK